MPASSINMYNMQNGRINFEAMRPAPVPVDSSVLGHCQKIHISTNCYYGYHDSKSFGNVHEDADCEMVEVSRAEDSTKANSSPLSNKRKRCADQATYPQTKRLREEVQIKKKIEPETTETKKLDTSSEDLLEALYWNLHGGNYFHLLQCP